MKACVMWGIGLVLMGVAVNAYPGGRNESAEATTWPECINYSLREVQTALRNDNMEAIGLSNNGSNTTAVIERKWEKHLMDVDRIIKKAAINGADWNLLEVSRINPWLIATSFQCRNKRNGELVVTLNWHEDEAGRKYVLCGVGINGF